MEWNIQVWKEGSVYRYLYWFYLFLMSFVPKSIAVFPIEPAGIQEQQSPFPRSYPSGPVRAININIDTDKIVKEYIQ